MSDPQLRARVLLEEARTLGIDLADLIAADTTSAARIPTVADYLESVAPTFTAATAATYRPHWRLAIARLGDRRLADVTIEDLTLVVADAETRARRLRPASTGRSSRETCVAALRAVFGRAAVAGLISANPAAVLAKPRRARSRRRARSGSAAGQGWARSRGVLRDWVVPLTLTVAVQRADVAGGFRSSLRSSAPSSAPHASACCRPSRTFPSSP